MNWLKPVTKEGRNTAFALRHGPLPPLLEEPGDPVNCMCLEEINREPMPGPVSSAYTVGKYEPMPGPVSPMLAKHLQQLGSAALK